MSSAEQRFFRTFVTPSKRERYCDFLRSKKGRGKVHHELYHFRHFDPRYVVQLPRSNYSGEEVLKLLLSKGAAADCRIVSACGELDGRQMSLQEAVERIVDGSAEGSVINEGLQLTVRSVTALAGVAPRRPAACRDAWPRRSAECAVPTVYDGGRP